MTSYDNPWRDIPTAAAGQFSRRRAQAATQFALFWFRDENNSPGLLVEISKSISLASLKEARISIRDISIDVLDLPDEGIRALIVKLENDEYLDVFLKLCQDLIERVTSANQNQYEEIFHIVCQRLRKWQSLLSRRSRDLLSGNEIQGLYAELYFIAEMLTEDVSRETLIIRGWEGPEKAQQDFYLDDMAIEVKSVAGNQRGKVRISSEHQLDTHLNELYLRVYFLSEILDSANGESLNAIVERIASHLIDSRNKEFFESKLGSARYIDIQEYDTPLFRVKDCKTYLVSEDFPRVTRKTLPVGIEAVSYDLVLADIEQFRTMVEIMGG